MIVSTEKLKEFTTVDGIKSRPDVRLKGDLMMAEGVVKKMFTLKGKSISDFSTDENVILAICLYAEYYGLKSILSSNTGYKSESLPDYSYQKDDGTSLKEPNVLPLLDDILNSSTVKPLREVNFKLRRI